MRAKQDKRGKQDKLINISYMYDIYLALLCARSMLALTSATPGMPYAAVSALGISTPGRSLSRVIPAVCNVRGVRIEVALHTHVCSQVSSRARVPASPTGCTRPKRGVRDLRRPPLERDFFFLMLPLRPYACARCMFAYASRMRCMQPVCTSSFRTMTFGAYRAFQAWARSTRAVRNHFFLLMSARWAEEIADTCNT
jgi:hypothetical protein